MALFTEADLLKRAQAGGTIRKSISLESARAMTHDSAFIFDIFLSHSFTDKNMVEGLMGALQDLGFSVYVDWVHDKELSRDKVTPETAQTLRDRMKVSRCLFFATTQSSSGSKWMPWELGYMDGFNGRAAVLPIAKSNTQSYSGQEYLGIYPYVQEDPNRKGDKKLWIHRSPNTYVVFEDWLEGKDPYSRDKT
ncbi:toll/interleukin-1 receptor domain-containing protein [Pelomonas sp. P7]|uniref:Toll/interleukin-1 receptor domain-containing protein n=1 Tax=Pelomonas caseinilytica TaxID=2906763 RepID=A0ABS8XNU5_9BURK|nr:toll/interleukin-1 receptor domain-containing protein [Pelomonas sp. P7]MCE4540783.1 toll/interleukin-1 receptor domain-containing protein [Pelomonas sp. P7]